MRTALFGMPGVVLLVALAGGGCQARGPEAHQLAAGYTALEQKQYDQAIGVADTYLKGEPNGPDAAAAHYLRGRGIYGRVKADPAHAAADMQEARNCYARSLALNPAPALQGLVYADLANLAYQQEQYRQAEEQWTRSYGLLEQEEVRGVVLYQIARCRQRQSKWKEADEALAMVQQRFPDSELAKAAHDKQGYRDFWVQVAAYGKPSDADIALAALRAKGLTGIRKPSNGAHAVLVGPRPTYESAKALRNQLAGTYRDAFIRP